MAALTVAIMQPYFLPYAGYFRLFAASDLFVVYDCVQFPRRGWVHRNRLVDRTGSERWMTLPIERAPQHVLIRDLCFPQDAAKIVNDRLRAFPLAARTSAGTEAMIAALGDVRGTPVDYIERLLHCTVGYCGMPWNVVRSSSLNVPADVRGQQRILEIARRLGATRYVNAPGGRDLYDAAAFADVGIDLRFLPPYVGSHASILTRMVNENRGDLVRDIHSQSIAPALSTTQ